VQHIQKTKKRGFQVSIEVREKRIELKVTQSERDMIDDKAEEIYMSRTEFIVRACEMVKSAEVAAVRDAGRVAK
jgi:uncharacterized protein (DUF1778 family)